MGTTQQKLSEFPPASAGRQAFAGMTQCVSYLIKIPRITKLVTTRLKIISENDEIQGAEKFFFERYRLPAKAG